MKSIKTLFLCTLLVAGGMAARGASAQAPAAAGCDSAKLIAAYPGVAKKNYRANITGDVKPYGYRDPGDLEKVTGISADLARAALACLGSTVEFAVSPFSGAMPALQAGQVDMIWTPLYYTPERAKVVDILLWQKGASGLVVAKGNPQRIKQMSDLCGKHAAALTGSTELPALNAASDACKAAGKEAIDVVVAQDKASALRQVQNGRLDAYSGIGVPLAYDDTLFEMPYLFPTATRMGVGLRKDSGQLGEALRDAIAALQASGAEAALYKKYQIDPALSVSPPVIAHE